jgi:hypothetical protein
MIKALAWSASVGLLLAIAIGVTAARTAAQQPDSPIATPVPAHSAQSTAPAGEPMVAPIKRVRPAPAQLDPRLLAKPAGTATPTAATPKPKGGKQGGKPKSIADARAATAGKNIPAGKALRNSSKLALGAARLPTPGKAAPKTAITPPPVPAQPQGKTPPQ